MKILWWDIKLFSFESVNFISVELNQFDVGSLKIFNENGHFNTPPLKTRRFI